MAQKKILSGMTIGSSALPRTNAINKAPKKLSGMLGYYTEDKNRGGLAGGLEYLGASVLAGAGGVVEGTLDLIGGGIAALTGNKAYAEYLFENNVVGDWHKRIEDGYNPNGAIKFAGDVTTGLGQSATMLIPYVGVPLFFAGVGGQGVSTAVGKTGELGAKEWIYGGLSGAAEGALEYFVGKGGTALATVGKKAGKSITAKIASNVAKEWAASAAWKGVAKNMLTSASGEFVEEFLAEYIDTALLRMTGVDKEATTDLRQAAYAGLVGFASGLAMGGIASGIDSSRSYMTGRRVADAGNADTLIKTADKMITDAKIGKDSVVDNTIKQLKNSVEMYKKAENKGSDAALIYLGEVKSYMAAVETIHAVRSSAARLSTVNEAQATAYAKAMSYFDGNSEVSKNYTAQDWFDNKNDIRTRYAAMGWAGAFLSDSRAEVETAAFNKAIAADMAGRAVGKPTVADIAGAEWDGSDATFYVGDANRGEGEPSEGDYLRIAKDAKGGYYMAVGNNAEGAQGFAGRTENEVRELFNGYRDAIVQGRTKRAAEAEISARAAEARARADAMNAPESFATKSDKRGAQRLADKLTAEAEAAKGAIPDTDALRDQINAGSGRIAENRYTEAQTDAARKAVKNFDMLDADTKAKILRWIESVEGKGVDADVVSAVAAIMRVREGLQVIYADTKEGVAGFHDEIKKADRNLIVLSSKNDLDLLRETIAHELGHDVENAEGFEEIKKAAVKATKEADLKEWEELYKKNFPDMKPEEIENEVAMKALGRRLATPRFLNRYANKSTLRRLVDAGKQLIEYLRADEAGKLAIAETEKLINMMDRAIMGVNVQVEGKSAGKPKYLYIGDTKDGRRCYKSGFDSSVDMNERIRLFKERIATIFNLGAVELKTDVKKIKIKGDAFTKQKNLFGDKKAQPEEYEAKINALYDLADILATSKYDPAATQTEESFINPNISPKNLAHKDVKYWYKFRNNIVFDGVPYQVTFSIRDKGKEQYQYFIDFKEDKTPGLSNTVVKNLLRADQTSHNLSIAQNSQKSTPSAKKSHNLTESEAERAAQDAAEVEAFLNATVINQELVDEALNARAAIAQAERDMAVRETNVQAAVREAYEYRREALKKERQSEISRIEVMARDYNDYYYQYDAVHELLKKFNDTNKLKIYPLNDASFITYQELNAVRRNFARGDDSYLRSTLVQLVNGIIDMSSLKGASDAEVRDVKNNLYLTLRDYYESAAKQTPRGKSKERIEGLKDAIRDERTKYARYKDARDIERGAEIMRIETSAKDNNEQYWQYTDVRDTIRTLDKEASLNLNDINTVAFEVYRALNHIRGKIEGSELDSQIEALSEIVYEAYEQQNGKAPRSTATNDTRIHDALRTLYNTKAKQTPRSKSKERVEYTRGQAKLHTLIDRLDRRRERLNKTRGSLAIKEWQKLVNAAHKIRPRFELSYDGLASFFEAFLEFANHAAPSAYTAANAAYKADSESEADAAAKLVAKYAEERQEGHNQLLDYIDPRLLENMIGIYEAMRPSESENADGKKASKIITPEMLQTASIAIQKMLSMDSRVDKIFRDGRWEDTRIKATEMLEGYSRGHRGRIGKSESKKGFKKLLESFVMSAVDPETAVHLVEGVFGDNTLSELVHAVKMSYERARADRDDWLKKFEEFQKSKDHKAWRKEWNEGEMTLKWTSITIDGKTVTQETTVTKQEAAQLYMTSKREQALAAIALGRLEFAETTGKGGRKLGVRKIGVSNETVDKLIGMEESEVNDIMLKLEVSAKASISELFNQFSETDKQYIKLIESFYNNTSKTVKKLCDTEYYGFTNIIEGYYVPISRGNTTVDIDLIASRVRSANDIPVSGFKFNISTVKGARSRLVIGSAQAVLERHAQQLSLYKNMTLPLQNIQRLYNYKQAVSIDNVYSVREFIKDYVWDGMDVYLSDYFKDVQGMRTSYDTVSVMARTVKGGVAKSVLGLNLASGIKQLSSFIQLFGVAKFNAVVRGIDPKLWKSSKEDLDKWSVLARNRHSNVEMYYAAGAAGKIGKVGDLLMTHLAIGDRSAQILFWAVAQQQAKLDGKGEIGTDSNKEYAADLVDKWTLLIQDTSSPTTKSALARHPQELVSAMTMFQSASMKIFSRGVSAIHELYLLHQMSKRSDLTADEKTKVEEAQSNVGKAAAALGGTILAGALFESIIGLIRDKIRGNDDEEEEDAKRIAIDTMLSVVGTVPVIGGFAESAFSGYDITEFYTDFLNDGVVAMRNTANVTAKIAAGEVVESEEILKSLKGVTVFAGQMMGIPVNNAMNIVKSTLNLTSPQAAYRYEAMFYEPSYTADLEKAIKSGKSDLAETIYRLSSKDIKTGKIADSLVVDEIMRLYGDGHNVIPRSAPTTYDNDEGESVKVKAKQARDFEEIYSLADRAAAMVVTAPVYASLSSELQAKAIRVTYDIYHSRAKSEVFGAELSTMAALSYFEEYIDVPTLVAESAYIYGIKGTAEAKRSELVKAYISGYSKEAQAILLFAAGYRSEAVKEVISGLYGRLDADKQKSAKNIFDF